MPQTPEERRARRRLTDRARRARNLESRRAYDREWKSKKRAADPEKARAIARKLARAAREKATPEQLAHRRALQAIYDRRYRLRHPEENLAKGRRSYHRHREIHVERNRTYRAAHPEERRSYNQTRRRLHGDMLRAAERARWAALPPEVRQAKARAKNQALKISVHRRRLLDPMFHVMMQEKERAKEHRRRAQLAQAPVNDLTAAQWRDIKAAYGHRCVYCGEKTARLTMDHITPLVKGGAHTKHNIVPACRSCNSRKHAGPVLKPIQPLLL